MSKGNSGLFLETSGANEETISLAVNIISSRTKGLDLQEHPRSNVLSSKSRKEIAAKIKSRTASKEDYKKYSSDKRFSQRRKEGVKQFWVQEQMRILTGKPTTRNWSEEQR